MAVHSLKVLAEAEMLTAYPGLACLQGAIKLKGKSMCCVLHMEMLAQPSSASLHADCLQLAGVQLQQ